MYHYVMWSGGCDSTLVLLQLLANREILPDFIYPVSVIHDSIGEKCFNEERIRKEFLKSRKINDCINICGDAPYINGYGGSPQATLWAGLIAPLLPAECTLYFGYVRGDDFWHHKHPFEKALFYLHQVHYGDDGKLIIKYPLEWHTKVDVFEELEDVHKIKLDSLWWCEENKRDTNPCGKCLPCLTHKENYDKLCVKRSTSLEVQEAVSEVKEIEEIEEVKEIGQPISRSEALQISNEILVKAETERSETEHAPKIHKYEATYECNKCHHKETKYYDLQSPILFKLKCEHCDGVMDRTNIKELFSTEIKPKLFYEVIYQCSKCGYCSRKCYESRMSIPFKTECKQCNGTMDRISIQTIEGNFDFYNDPREKQCS